MRSLEKDRDDLKNILMESEKSRIEVKTKFNNSKYSCLAIENKLKLKEDEVNNLNRRIETLNQERKLLFDELESAGYVFFHMFDQMFIFAFLVSH